MKKLFKGKNILIGSIVLIVVIVLVSGLIISRNISSNRLNISINKINKALVSSKNDISKTRKKIEKNDYMVNKSTFTLFKKNVTKTMDYMSYVHEVNDSLEKIVSIKNISKVKDNTYDNKFKSYNKELSDSKRELRKVKKQKNNKLVKKIDIDECLKFIKKTEVKSDNYSSIVKFLNANKDLWNVDSNEVIFIKRDIYEKYEELTKKYENNIKYKLINDNVGPYIKADSFKITVGEKIDIKTKISCVDEVDGEVECSIQGSYDVNKEGEYPLKIEAKDKSNNTSSKDIVLTVVAKKVDTSNKNPYYTEVIRNQNVVIVYGLDDNLEYTKIVKVFPCSVGLNNNTPIGTFTTSNKYVWRALYGGVYGQYATRITSDILFHSVPYYSQNKGDLESEEFNKLGTAASMGCVRMTVNDVKWIYDNCPRGMTVKIYDGNLPSGVSKPTAPKIDLSSPNKGWDPTDPDASNPWR